MRINFSYQDQEYLQFTKADAVELGIPDAVWNDAYSAALWQQIRNVRNKKISDCDWTVLSDAPLDTAQKTAWKAYRDALRDFPETLKTQNIAPDVALNDPSVWPQKPQ